MNRRRIVTLLAMLCFAAPASAQSITVPATVQIDTPGLIVIRATAADLDDARWYPLSPGIQTFPPDVIPPNPKVFLGLALAPGVYKIGVVPAKDVGGKAKIGDAQVCTVTVGTPPPPPPPPPSTLQQTLQAAYATCTDPQKSANVPKVAKVFAQGAVFVGAVNPDKTPTYATWGDLDTAVVNYSRNTVGLAGTEVPAIIAAIQTYAQTTIPESKTTTNPISNRIAAANTYQQIAAALTALTLTKKGAR